MSEEAVVETVREHRGQGARKAARRKFRHAPQNTLLAEILRNPKTRGLSPAAARFRARVSVDVSISQGLVSPEVAGRSLLRK